MAEWSKAADLKSVELFIGFRGFESYSLRFKISTTMKFSNLKVEPIKTLMATQRLILTRFGYAISFMGDEQSLTSGDGVSTFEIKVFKHHLDLDQDIDFFNENINPDVVDFKHCLFSLKNVTIGEIDDFFDSFIL